MQLWPIHILNWYHDQDQNLQPKTFAFLTCLRDINWSHVIHVTFLYTVELFVAIANAFTTKIRLSLSCHPFLYHISSGFCLNIEALVCESAIKMRTIQLLLETVLSLRIRFCHGKCYNYTETIVYFNPLVTLLGFMIQKESRWGLVSEWGMRDSRASPRFSHHNFGTKEHQGCS